MKLSLGAVRLSAGDLSNHLGCRHVTSLDLAVAAGHRTAPEWRSPDLWVLQERGREHEKGYLRREYLFGFTAVQPDGASVYQCRWALSSEDEKRAFEWFVDAVTALWAQYPAMFTTSRRMSLRL